jgi:hypothetical protein
MFLLHLGIVKPTHEPWEQLQKLLALFCKAKAMPAHMWQRLLGLLAATERLVPQGLLHMSLFNLVWRKHGISIPRVKGSWYRSQIICAPHYSGGRIPTMSSRTTNGDFYWCFPVRLGGSFGPTESSGCMDRGAVSSAYQYTRTGSSSFSTPSFSSAVDRQVNTDCDRQYYSHVVHQPSRWDQIGQSISVSRDYYNLVSTNVDLHSCSSHPGLTERISWPIIATTSGYCYGMATPQRGVSGYLSPMGHPSRGSLCNLFEPSPANVCIANARPTSTSSQCVVNQLDMDVGVCLPSYSYSSSSSVQNMIPPVPSTSSS